MRSLSVYVLMIAATATAPVAEASIPSFGFSHSSIESAIDNEVRRLVRNEKLPGITVAVVKNGRLVHNKGYGYADIDKKHRMLPQTRARIGSNSKPITGAALYQLLRSKGLKTKIRLFGKAPSVFGSTYNTDWTKGASRHAPIVGIAIAPNDRVHAWYSNGTMSIGTTSDLDRRAKPKKYTLPPGKTPWDIVDIAISKNGTVHVWYDDGLRSAGSATDLDATRKLSKSATKWASGRNAFDVAGIAINKRNDRVFAWYDDGTLSSGRTWDLSRAGGKYSALRIGRDASYRLRGIGLAKKGAVYAWFTNGKATSGTLSKLDHKRAPYAYKIPGGPLFGGAAQAAWYNTMTLEDVLQHQAGFVRDRDISGAALHWHRSSAQITRAQHNRHILQTRALKYKPKTQGLYSNVGFGLLDPAIQKYAKMPYETYVAEKLLKPFNLKGRIVPDHKVSKFDVNIATPYYHSDDKLKSIPSRIHVAALASGGWLATARDMLKLSTELRKRHTWSVIDVMGWGPAKSSSWGRAPNGQAAMWKNGSQNGGASFMIMFPSGFRTEGKDLSRVQIALVTNTHTTKSGRKASSALSDLAKAISKKVAGRTIPVSVNHWNTPVAVP